MATLFDYQRLSALIQRAAAKGARRISQVRWEWDCAGRCERPVPLELEARPSERFGAKRIRVARGTAHPLILTMHVPCRTCPSCRKARMKEWAARALTEHRQAQRSWFATFTFRPDAHYQMLGRGVLRAEARAIPADEIVGEREDRAQFEECAREITLYLKRVRKNTGARIRYILVAERHKSGLPHFHALIHEVTGSVKYEDLRSQWHHGFGMWKLVRDEAAAFYVVKYLGKAQDARVRASLHYGRQPGIRANPIASEASVLSEYLDKCQNEESHKERTTK